MGINLFKTTDYAYTMPITNSQEIKHQDARNWQNRKLQRRSTSLEHDREAHQQLHEQQKANLFEHQELEYNKENYHDAWDGVINTEIHGSSAAQSGELNAYLEQELLQQFAARYLEIEELDILWEFCDGEEGISREEAESLVKEIMDADEGSETAVLDKFLGKKQNGTVSIYLALNYLMHALRNHRSKKFFQRQLAAWLTRFEEQEGSVLFEFFSLVNNQELKVQFKHHDLNKLAELNSAKIVIANLKQSVELIASTFNNKFEGLVSTFMKLKARQLSLLTQAKLNGEGKAQLYDLMHLEKNLIIVSSLNSKQNKFYEQLTKSNFLSKEQLGDNPAQALLGTLVFCEASFVSELTVDKLWRSWKLQINDQTDAGLRLIPELISFVLGLPIAIFNDNPANLQKVVSGLRSMLVDKAPAKTSTGDSTNSLFILRPISKLVKYV